VEERDRIPWCRRAGGVPDFALDAVQIVRQVIVRRQVGLKAQVIARLASARCAAIQPAGDDAAALPSVPAAFRSTCACAAEAKSARPCERSAGSWGGKVPTERSALVFSLLSATLGSSKGSISSTEPIAAVAISQRRNSPAISPGAESFHWSRGCPASAR